jgi:CheY-like chemotaxis protein
MAPFRVLIADPDVVLLSAYHLLLVGQDIELRTAGTGPACREALQNQPPDLLVLDPQLPGLRPEEYLACPDQNGVSAPRSVLLLAASDEVLPQDLLCHPGVTILFKPVCPVWLAGAIESFARSNRAAFAPAS